METVLYIAAIAALLVFMWFLLRAARTLGEVSIVLQRSQPMLDDVRKSATQVAADVALMRMQILPVIDSVSEITSRASRITEGLTPRVEALYDTIDDALDVAHGVIDDVERIKTEVVDTIESPLKVVRHTSNGLGSTIIKGFNLVRELVQEFKKNKTDS
ncbi:MAG TPA: hypothetical protein VEW28_00060 [Candidatus Kapabacteria bacterium]|nr:hypothetical protein [Candidatus Kapabacteria bacterium]